MVNGLRADPQPDYMCHYCLVGLPCYGKRLRITWDTLEACWSGIELSKRSVITTHTQWDSVDSKIPIAMQSYCLES